MTSMAVPFKNKFSLHLENYQECRTGDLRFDIVLVEHDDGGDEDEFLRLIGARWSFAKGRILPPADLLRRPHPKTGAAIHWDHWKHSDKLKRAVLMILEREGYVSMIPTRPVVAVQE